MIFAAASPGPTAFDVWAYIVIPAGAAFATSLLAFVSWRTSRSAARTAEKAAELARATAAAEQIRARREERFAIGSVAMDWIQQAYEGSWLIAAKPKPKFDAAERRLNEVMTSAEQHDQAVALSNELHDLSRPVIEVPTMNARRNASPIAAGSYALATAAVSRWVGNPADLDPVGKTGDDLELYLHQVGHFTPAWDHHPLAGSYEEPEPLEE